MSKAKVRAAQLDRPREVKPLSFRFYLKQRRDRVDAVGDLARYVLSHRGDLPANNLGGYRAQLQQVGATDEMLRALEDAWAEYEESRRV
jgi:hypothetical protein